MSKSILIFGGVRPLGRAIAVAAVHSGEYETIRVVDSHIPELSCFTPKHTEAFAHIEVLQLNMAREEGEEVTDQAFAHPHVKAWTVVVNAYFEARYGLDLAMQMIHTEVSARNITNGARRWGCQVFVHLTCAVAFYHNKKMGKVAEGVLKEPQVTSPRSIAIVNAHNYVRSVEGLPMVILYLADPYGEGYFSTTEICLVGSRALTMQGDTELKCLWDDSDKLNTVHVLDVARATLHAAAWYVESDTDGTVMFNIVDGSETSRLAMSSVTGEALGVNVMPLPALVRAALLFSLKFDPVMESFKRSFMGQWIREVDRKGVIGAHFEMVVDAETLPTPWSVSLNGSKFRETTGFEYWYPEYTVEAVKEVVRYWETLDLWV